MLACGGVDLEDVTYPKYASPKVDGIRCLIIDGELYSRSMKEQPTKALKTFLSDAIEYSKIYGVVIDCELFDQTQTFQWHQSTFRSFDGQPLRSTRAWVIDVIGRGEWKGTHSPVPMTERLKQIRTAVESCRNLKEIPQKLVHSPAEALELYETYIDMGLEGMMLRDPQRGYKHGRSTPSEQWLLKFKCQQDTDAEIIDVFEGEKLKAGAETRVSPTGDKERSHKKSDYEPAGVAGGIRVRLEDGTECGIGTWRGWTSELRKDMWENRHLYIGRWIRFTSQAVGGLNKPRIPCGVRWQNGDPIVAFELRDDKK